ncbi:membrane-spanning 4-domains subfamily A member 8-like isoform X2 [Onychostoma macrolepis]|uniref:membrane-spanning 4-domains subfamily A member 8-like isoform X2 n=1 Tax=Onychostoma macrolepis TaxID=369639 RepID=UPI00272D9302|nr:membrane-spanning 4-domains subfamily A member 8-like isoform X2 [Onychostoma macrolepis]
MTLTVSRGEGLTVITVTSNPKSKWPVLCQILGFLCDTPSCSVSQGMKGKLKDVHTAFGIVQMIIGVLNIVVGIVFTSLGSWFIMYRTANGPFWIGSVFLVVGIMCVLTVKFPTSCLLTTGIVLNLVSAGLAIAAVVLYSVDLANDHTNEYCIIFRGLDIMMIVLSVLQLCVTISFSVLTGKALHKEDEDVKSVEDPELHKPLLEDATAAAV